MRHFLDTTYLGLVHTPLTGTVCSGSVPVSSVNGINPQKPLSAQSSHVCDMRNDSVPALGRIFLSVRLALESQICTQKIIRITICRNFCGITNRCFHDDSDIMLLFNIIYY